MGNIDVTGSYAKDVAVACLKASLPLYLLERVTVGTANCFLDFAPLLKVISNCLSVSYASICE